MRRLRAGRGRRGGAVPGQQRDRRALPARPARRAARRVAPGRRAAPARAAVRSAGAGAGRARRGHHGERPRRAAAAAARARPEPRRRARPLDPSASSQFVSALLLLGPLPARRRGDRARRGAAVAAVRGADRRGAGGVRRSTARARRTDGSCARHRGGLRPATFVVEGDWSAAAFPLAAAAVAGGEVEVAGVRLDSRQGDAAVAGLLAEAGCRVRATTAGRGAGRPGDPARRRRPARHPRPLPGPRGRDRGSGWAAHRPERARRQGERPSRGDGRPPAGDGVPCRRRGRRVHEPGRV